MSYVKVYELETAHNCSTEDRFMLMTNVDTAPVLKAITIGQLLGLQNEALNKPCHYCGSRGKYDIRGNCGACGAPQ